MINKNFDKIEALVLEGISLLNTGKFFAAHETLETAWRLEKAPVRVLYQGLIQFSVACYHAERSNWVGAGRVLHRARKNLIPFIHEDSMIDVEDAILQIDILDERLMRRKQSNTNNQEFGVSPFVKIKGCKDQEVIPGSK